MQFNFLVFTIPAFLIFFWLEFLLAKKIRKPDLFKYESSIANISVGIAERLLNLFLTASFYGVFSWIYTNYALFKIPDTWWVWAILILLTDLVWYWYHRLSHEINLFWAVHIVHHQSEEFNLTVAARITVFQSLVRNVFWCIIPFLGFHPDMVVTILIVHGAYSFFTHTRVIGKLGWLEHILITPSLHGIHHASDEKYLDKNYGDVFTFWDKLFGTYMQEEEAPKYGLTHPVKSYSLLWQHFHYFLEIIAACKRTGSFKEKLKIIFGSPALLDQDIRPELERKYLQHKNSTDYRFRFSKYLNYQIAGCIILLAIITAFYRQLSLPDHLFIASLILITLVNCGALMEQRRWIYDLECVRLILVFTYLCFRTDYSEYLIVPVILIFLIDELFSLRDYYNKHVLHYVKN